MGCSLVTIFEVLHHIFLRTSVKSVNRIHKTIRCAPRTDEPPSGITMAAFMQLGSNINVFAPNPGMYFGFFFTVLLKHFFLVLNSHLLMISKTFEVMNFADLFLVKIKHN